MPIILYLALLPIGLSLISRIVTIDPDAVERERQAYYEAGIK